MRNTRIAGRLTGTSFLAAAALALGRLPGFSQALGGASPRPEDDILTRSRAMYASLKSYADAGTVVHEYGPTSESRHTFKTYYPRPATLLFRVRRGQGSRRQPRRCLVRRR